MTEIKKQVHDPQLIVEKAVKELADFTDLEANRLELADGHLVAVKGEGGKLKKITHYLTSLFTSHKQNELKQAVLRARENIEKHDALIARFKQGDEAQRELAEYAEDVITRYNKLISRGAETSEINYERKHILADLEIKNHPIKLNSSISVNSDNLPHQKMIQGISETLFTSKPQPAHSLTTSIHKKMNFIDIFQMKAIRLLGDLLKNRPKSEIVQLIKGTPLHIDEKTQEDVVIIQQHVEVEPGIFITIIGNFKRKSSDPNLLNMPILDIKILSN